MVFVEEAKYTSTSMLDRLEQFLIEIDHSLFTNSPKWLWNDPTIFITFLLSIECSIIDMGA